MHTVKRNQLFPDPFFYGYRNAAIQTLPSQEYSIDINGIACILKEDASDSIISEELVGLSYQIN
jgi:hypothetical protein